MTSDVFTMVDDGSLPNRRGTMNFNDEGTQMSFLLIWCCQQLPDHIAARQAVPLYDD
jgi:hypothetical protein